MKALLAVLGAVFLLGGLLVAAAVSLGARREAELERRAAGDGKP